jgi:hypothetical protein
MPVVFRSMTHEAVDLCASDGSKRHFYPNEPNFKRLFAKSCAHDRFSRPKSAIQASMRSCHVPNGIPSRRLIAFPCPPWE